MDFWSGFYKKASIGPKIGITRGLFSRDGIKQTTKSNPLPTNTMKTMPPARVSGRGVGSMAVP